MLRIRKAQLEVLSKDAAARFETRMVERLRTSFPVQTKPKDDDALRAAIRGGVEKAATYKVTDESDVERYLDCVAEYGPDFDSSPATAWAGEILRNRRLDGTEKMNRIDNHKLLEAIRRTK